MSNFLQCQSPQTLELHVDCKVSKVRKAHHGWILEQTSLSGNGPTFPEILPDHLLDFTIQDPAYSICTLSEYGLISCDNTKVG